ncbi:MAG: hypothetical protein ACMXYD_03215 [Candidatus Woesearchaeota archaeon]
MKLDSASNLESLFGVSQLTSTFIAQNQVTINQLFSHWLTTTSRSPYEKPLLGIRWKGNAVEFVNGPRGVRSRVLQNHAGFPVGIARLREEMYSASYKQKKELEAKVRRYEKYQEQFGSNEVLSQLARVELTARDVIIKPVGEFSSHKRAYANNAYIDGLFERAFLVPSINDVTKKRLVDISKFAAVNRSVPEAAYPFSFGMSYASNAEHTLFAGKRNRSRDKHWIPEAIAAALTYKQLVDQSDFLTLRNFPSDGSVSKLRRVRNNYVTAELGFPIAYEETLQLFDTLWNRTLHLQHTEKGFTLTRPNLTTISMYLGQHTLKKKVGVWTMNANNLRGKAHPMYTHVTV